jgi:hypothetical protein
LRAIAGFLTSARELVLGHDDLYQGAADLLGELADPLAPLERLGQVAGVVQGHRVSPEGGFALERSSVVAQELEFLGELGRLDQVFDDHFAASGNGKV